MAAALVVFDLDDTLYKEHTFVASGRRAVARYGAEISGMPYEDLIAVMETQPPTFRHAFELMIERIHRTGARRVPTVEECIEVYRAHTPDIVLPESSRRVLEELKQRGHRIAVATDGTSRTQRLKIKALGLDKYLAPDGIIVSEEVGGDKTTGAPLEALAGRFPDAERRFFVGDSLLKDFYLPRMNGWHTIMLADPTGENIHPQRLHDHPAERLPHTVVYDLRDILPLIN